ncbi:mobile element protein [Streptomyces fradiae]|uniref:mobile element protein n=1 Tax=Streptomyces fradiae TaxID=1906 RepID=UPI002942C11C|nr:mobile element protein [Streptomyces fradiae]WOI58609.1 mobile element protein [Streptomyces fradiae]
MASPWATPEELRLHLRLATIDAEQAAVKLAEAERVIRGELEQTIDAVADDTTVLVGNGRRVLLLPELPVTAVTSVTEDGTLLTEGTDYRANRYGLLTRLGGCWPLDVDITVVYDHGTDPVPAIITQVCLQVAGRAWVRATTAVAAESLGDRSLTYDKDRSGQALTDYELRILRPYMRGPASR